KAGGGHRQSAESDPIQHSALSGFGQRLIRCCDYSNRVFIWRARFFLPLAEQLRVCHDHTAALLSPLAVIRFTTKSNLVGCSTGMSAGLVPRRILSTSSAERRNRSGKFGP